MKLAVAALAAMLLWAAPALADDYDALNGVALNTTPHRVVAPLTATRSWDSSAFGVADEGAGGAVCDGAQGSRSAWVRFSTHATGKLALTARAGYPVILTVSQTTLDKDGTAKFGDLQRESCVKGTSMSGVEIESETVVWVQVLSSSGSGGPTSLDLTFTPNNNDGDDLPNGVDQCPDESGPANGRPTPGCPDVDGDGVTVPGDLCPDVYGTDVNGCPAAPGGSPVPTTGPTATPTPSPTGAPSAYPSLVGVTRVQALARKRHGTTRGFKGFRVTGTRPGMVIHIECDGRGCPFAHRAVSVPDGTTSLLVGRGLRRLRPGAQVSVRPRLPNHIAPAGRYTIQRSGPAAAEAMCTLPTAPRRLTTACS